ncbi:MAG TPA: hypothetical protein VH137_05705, partial [Gemmatimonadales bacterium]|nr:hypothetical protein [Gemmatimonadales bacterium]
RKLEEYRAHRLDREAQVRAELGKAPGTARELTERVYGADVGDELMRAAEMTMRAHLQKLVDEGKARTRPARGDEVFEPVQ